MILFFVPLPDRLAEYTEHTECILAAQSTDEAIAIWEGIGCSSVMFFPDEVWLISDVVINSWLRGK